MASVLSSLCLGAKVTAGGLKVLLVNKHQDLQSKHLFRPYYHKSQPGTMGVLGVDIYPTNTIQAHFQQVRKMLDRRVYSQC